MRILLIRHGQDPKDFRGGWSRLGLTEVGLYQAGALANYIFENWQPLELVISSDLPRALQTANKIATPLKIEVKIQTEWREMNNGDLAGMPNHEAEANYPGIYFGTLAMNQPFPNGESPREFQLRVHKAFDTIAAKILSRSLPENIALVTHAGVINILYYRLKGLEWNNKKPVFPSTCTGLHEVRYLEGNWKVTVENDSTHLRTRKR